MNNFELFIAELEKIADLVIPYIKISDFPEYDFPNIHKEFHKNFISIYKQVEIMKMHVFSQYSKLMLGVDNPDGDALFDLDISMGDIKNAQIVLIGSGEFNYSNKSLEDNFSIRLILLQMISCKVYEIAMKKLEEKAKTA